MAAKQPTMTAQQILVELRGIFGDDEELELWLSTKDPVFNAKPKDLLGTREQIQIINWINQVKQGFFS